MPAGALFEIFRILEILTLIPCWAILAWFISHIAPATAPDWILLMFVIALLATVYCFFTWLAYRSWAFTPLWIALLDLCFMAVFIAADVILAPQVVNTNCVTFGSPSVLFYASDGEVVTSADSGIRANNQCLMLKAAWGLGIANTVMLFLTFVLALMIWQRSGEVVYVQRPTRRRRRF